MWSAISTLSNAAYNAAAVGANAAYSAGAAIGVVTTGEANLPSAYPFKQPATPAERIALSHGHNYNEFIRIIDDAEWGLIPFTDPDGGDIKLWTRPKEVTHHFMKATFLSLNKTPAEVAALVASESLADRQRFSPNMEALDYLVKDDDKTCVTYTKFWAPPPIAARDFVFLQGRKELSDGTIEIWGCSVGYESKSEDAGLVRGASFWGWRLRPAMEHVMVTYFNVSDPRGWTPSFIFAWLKTQVSSDLVAIRDILSGKDRKVAKIESVESCGISQEEVQKEQAAFKATHDGLSPSKVPPASV